MTGFFKVIALLTVVLHCNGLRIREQARRRGNRRALSQNSVIVGAPSYPSHLPEAEPILPAHTLIRPSLGMLKSAVKFPHRELEDGSGVYGHIDNLGIRYDGRNERVLYTGFRRSNSNAPILVILPIKSRSHEHKVQTIKDKNIFLSKIIQDVLTDQKHRNSNENGDLSKEIRNSKFENRGAKSLFLVPKNIHLENIQSILNSLRRQKLNTKINQNIETLTKTYNDEDKVDGKRETLYETIAKNDADEYDEPVFEFHNDTNNIDPFLQVTQSNGTHKPKTKEERKHEWLMGTKDQGDHIIYDKSAPDFKEFFQNYTRHDNVDIKGVQNWWYFNQADFTKLSVDRRDAEKEITNYKSQGRSN